MTILLLLAGKRVWSSFI